MGNRVTISRDDGELGSIDESELQVALDSGFRVVEQDEATAIRKRREAQSTGGMALGTVEAIGRGATFGGTDILARGLGADMEAAAARQANLGTFGRGAEVVGAVAPSLIPGGGAVGAVARLTPAGAVARGGAAVSRGATRALGGGTAAKIAGSAVGQGLEGMVAGAGAAASEAALGDRDLAAEQLLGGALTGGGMGALLGGAGTGLGLGLGAAYRGSRRVAAAQIEKALGAGPAPGGASRADGLLGAATRRQTETLSRALGLADDEVAANVAAADRYLGRTRDAGGRRLLDLAQGKASKIDEAVGQAMAPAIPRAGAGSSLRQWKAILDGQTAGRKMLAKSAGEAADALNGVQSKEARKIMSLLRQQQKGVEDFASFDRTRGRVESQLQKMIDAGDMETARAQSAVAGYLDAGRNPSVWGKEITARDAVLAGQQAEKAALDALTPKARAALTGGELDVAALGKADPAAVAKVLDARVQQLDALEQVGIDVAKARQGIEDLRAGARLRDDVAAAADDLGRLKALEQGAGPLREGLELTGEVSGALLGGLSFGGGVLGKAVGTVAGLATRPAATMRVVARVRGGLDALAQRQGAAVKAFAALADGGARAARATGRATAATARRVAPAAARKATQERRERLAATAARVTRLASSPAELANALGEDLRELHEAAPAVGGSLVAATARGIAYLARNVPSAYKPTLSATKPMIDPFALDAWGRRLAAVKDPIGAIELLGSGALTLEHADALRNVYPTIYAQLQGQILDEIGSRVSAGKPVAYAARVQLGLLGGLATDDSLRPEVYASIQASQLPAAGQPATGPAQQPGPPPVAAENVAAPPVSGWARLEGGL